MLGNEWKEKKGENGEIHTFKEGSS